MFRYEKTPPELTVFSNDWYVVDRDRDVWLRSLGTSGPSGDRVYALSVRGKMIAFEVSDTDEGALVEQMQTFGASHQARFAHGIPWQTFPDEDERVALEELAAEALLAYRAGERTHYGLPPEQHRVRLPGRHAPVHVLADFGYGTELSTGGDSNG
ncbi:hypothetical protein [Cellulomonas xiejunii]|uniref:Uncharacterized protein n=1 Tax=Cellulomonas xiejunii TaxID=2968083 RepID=A0ABY5KVK9_9CELL|nr:hypothetical protein [Cellulomonas xiejunii]MCC2314058.1 hypothetical protein [Cellulomonas xiejunii]MCC2322317.1 hypothetical protein [Cellulomonas xiejunii]UUI72368.1 hypothetical protein NP048_02545 [Cellulomonas xiejunii]